MTAEPPDDTDPIAMLAAAVDTAVATLDERAGEAVDEVLTTFVATVSPLQQELAARVAALPGGPSTPIGPLATAMAHLRAAFGYLGLGDQIDAGRAELVKAQQWLRLLTTVPDDNDALRWRPT